MLLGLPEIVGGLHGGVKLRGLTPLRCPVRVGSDAWLGVTGWTGLAGAQRAGRPACRQGDWLHP